MFQDEDLESSDSLQWKECISRPSSPTPSDFSSQEMYFIDVDSDMDEESVAQAAYDIKMDLNLFPRKGFRCTKSCRTYLTNYGLRSHEAQAHEQPQIPITFSCHKCWVTFSSQSDLADHLNVHMAERPFKCKLCSKTWKRKWNLDQHRIKAHGQLRRLPYSCTKCQRRFPWEQILKQHVRNMHSDNIVTLD